MRALSSAATGRTLIFVTMLLSISKSQPNTSKHSYRKVPIEGLYLKLYGTLNNVKTLAACGVVCARRSTMMPPCMAFDYRAAGSCDLYRTSVIPASPDYTDQLVYMTPGRFQAVLTSQGNRFHIYVSTNMLPYDEARSFCNNFGGYLLEFNTPDKREAIESIMTDSQRTQKYWIGANDIANEGQWVTDKDGLPLSAGLWTWEPNEPNNQGNEDCAKLAAKNMRVNDQKCYRNALFLCEKD